MIFDTLSKGDEMGENRDSIMEVRAQFLGQDGNMGFSQYRYYTLKLSGNLILHPVEIRYETVEDFLKNWHVARTS
jgi:hypothetical protein